MAKILVTGEKGELSVAIKEYLIQNGNADTTCVSVRGDNWKNTSFQGVDSIVHVAGIVPQKGVSTQLFYQVNRDLTGEIAKKAKTDGVRQFVYISSMAVYGIEPDIAVNRGTIYADTPCNPTSDYGKSKMQAEEILKELSGENFCVAIIRVPSIYSDTKREYFKQYQFLMSKMKCIPIAFQKCYRSAIYLENLTELIRLTIEENFNGILCPDDGSITTVQHCLLSTQNMKQSRIVGLIVETVLSKHPIIRGVYGTIAYDASLSDCFNGRYRIVEYEMIKERLGNVK